MIVQPDYNKRTLFTGVFFSATIISYYFTILPAMANSSKGSSKTAVTVVVVIGILLLLCCVGSACVGGIVYYVSSDKETNETDETSEKTTTKDEDSTKQTTEKTTSVEQKGYIEGSLGYPGEGIPDDLSVCAEDVYTLEETCTTEQIDSSRYTYGKGYKLEVAPGSYYVYAYRTSDPYTYGLYSEYVTCGMEYGCDSHEQEIVTVMAGETQSGIDPIDWYYEQ